MNTGKTTAPLGTQPAPAGPRPWHATVVAAVLCLALSAWAHAQSSSRVEDSVPILPDLDVRILKLKVQTQTLRALLSEAPGGLDLTSAAWRDSVGAMRVEIAALRTRTGLLRQTYERVPSGAGTRVARELDGLALTLDGSLRALAAAHEPSAARMQIIHVSAQLDAMREQVAAAERCCRTTLKERDRT